MTASTVKSTIITNIETVPLSATPSKELSSKISIVTGKIAAATTSIDEVNDVILMVPVPSNAVPIRIELLNDDLDSHSTPTLAANVGLFYSAIGGDQRKLGKASGDVISATCIATAITTLQSANVTPVD